MTIPAGYKLHRLWRATEEYRDGADGMLTTL